MKELIIPDVHEHCQTVRKLVAKYPDVDRRVFLGDWFDSFSTAAQPTFAAIAAKYVIELQQDPKNVFLLGNHDAHYRFPPRDFACSGFSGAKLQAISEIMREEHWQQFKLFYWTATGEWLLSHAGFHKSLLSERPGRWMDEAAEAAIKQAKTGRVHAWLAPGQARGGIGKGGCTWLDWNHEFEPVAGVSQIVGHTPCQEPEYKRSDSSVNLCLDTIKGGYAAIVDRGQVEVVRL